ncbi:MAG: single-stranded-DNA-specific exonuclease RecJ [Anaerolineales bacterium]|nr:single-stranded-DNA-specific exonuclease RecJ [Chloroflexota bacterium]MBL7163346.1 single-stranded-DNA-specific exonuclease RecJ [Anaerolineales bacterium]
MNTTQKRWQIASRITPSAEEALHGYPPILRQILFNRGYATHAEARAFLEAQPPFDTDPFQLKGVAEAVDRLQRAIENGEKIAIYGDYDADGVTATALLVGYFDALNVDVLGYIPHRFDEGYGLNKDAISVLSEEGVDIIISVDCGIRSSEEADHARSLGVDLIICDHHTPGDVLPNALAVIDPKRKDDSYPEKNLAGVGVAYKLACALDSKINGQESALEDYLDLVALGTVADLVPLIGENRSLVRQGLQVIRRPRRQGLLSLIGVSGLKPAKVTAADIGFALGPRLNAAGRLDTALDALNLLTTQDVFKAGRIAQQLEAQNRKRQDITRGIQAIADELAFADVSDPLLLFAAHPEFNAGVVGLAASRLTEQYYRPAVVGHIDEEYTRASCRSIPEFNITDALDRCADLLERHGGHAAAAGFTVRNENLPRLIERLQAIAEEQLSDQELQPTLNADIKLPLSELKPELLDHLEWMQPTGYGNPQASFVSRNVKVMSSRAVGKDSAHLKLVVSDGHITFDAIAFRLGHWYGNLPQRIDLLYHFEVNEFRGKKTLQLNVRDIKPSKV